jgi:hypothetical protein
MDKKFHQSKKFLALIFCMMMISGIMIVALVLQPITWPMALFMAAGMIANGSLSIGYVISQSALDRFLTTISDIGKKIKVEEKEEEPNDE